MPEGSKCISRSNTCRDLRHLLSHVRTVLPFPFRVVLVVAGVDLRGTGAGTIDVDPPPIPVPYLMCQKVDFVPVVWIVRIEFVGCNIDNNVLEQRNGLQAPVVVLQDVRRDVPCHTGTFHAEIEHHMDGADARARVADELEELVAFLKLRFQLGIPVFAVVDADELDADVLNQAGVDWSDAGEERGDLVDPVIAGWVPALGKPESILGVKEWTGFNRG